MPELPEVETVRRGLAPHLEQRIIKRVILRRPDLRFPFPDGLAERIEGKQVQRIERRGKYLVFQIQGDIILLNSLGMSGRWTLSGPGIAFTPGTFAHGASIGTGDGPHDHLVMEFDGGIRATYTDARRFGYVHLIEPGCMDADPFLRVLGPDPLDSMFDAKILADRLRGRKTPMKSALLNQSIVAGLGNIYVSEILHRAGVSPRRTSMTLVRKDGSPTERLERIVAETRVVLKQAIEAGGSTLQDFRGVAGEDEVGWFPVNFRVYGREGEFCKSEACSDTIRRIVQSNRSTFFCPSCQK